ncbi:hypothetical protein N2152v2_010488 [Parachlorella kessleri]
MGGCVSSHQPEVVTVTRGHRPSATKPAPLPGYILIPPGTGHGDALYDASSTFEQPPQQLQRQQKLPVQQTGPGRAVDSASSFAGAPLPHGAGAGSSQSAQGSHASGGAGASGAASRLGRPELDSAGSQYLAGGGTGSGGSGDDRPPGVAGKGFLIEGAVLGPPALLVSPFTNGASSAQQQQQQQQQAQHGSSSPGGGNATTPPGGRLSGTSTGGAAGPAQPAQSGDMTTVCSASTGIATPTPSMTAATSSFSSGGSGGVDPKAWTIPFSELQIIKQVGEGSYGRVYMAKWRETLVAVKVLLNTGVDVDDMEAAAELAMSLSNPVLLNLQKEASLMAALRHPNIVGFLGVCPTPPCVVSDFCSRGSLNDVLRAAKQNPAKAAQLDWVRRLNMALDAAKGMLYLHMHSPPIIHRDLKSPNLLVDKYWKVKVCDFNLSKIMEDTSSGASMATNNPRWLAPEVLAAQRATLASDVYSFGVVLWEMLTLELPWGRLHQLQIMKLVSEGQRLQVPARSALPPSSQGFEGLDLYEELVAKCWAEDPKERPTFADVIGYLRDLLGIAMKMGQGRNAHEDLPVPAERHRPALEAGMRQRAKQQAQQGQPSVVAEPRLRSEARLPHPDLAAQQALTAAAQAFAQPAGSNMGHLSKAFTQAAEVSFGTDVAARESANPASPSLEAPCAKDRSTGDVAALARQLGAEDKHLQEQAARALLDLARASPEHLRAIVSAGAVPRLVALLGSLEGHPQDSALWAMSNPLSMGHDKVPSVLPPDTLPAIAHLLEGCTADVQELRVTLQEELGTGREKEQAQAVERVVELTGASALNREEAANGGMAPALLDLLYGSGSSDLKRSAAKALANLCLEPTPAASVVAAKGIPLLLQLAQGEELQGEAAEALLSLACSTPEHLYAIVSAGGVPPLVQLLESGDKKLQGGAARLVAYLCQRDRDYQSAVVSASAIPLLVGLLEGGDTNLQARAAMAIGYLSHELFDFRSVIAAAGAVPALVRLLYSSDEDVQRFGAWALGSIAELSHTQQAAVAAVGAVAPLVRLLGSPNEDVQGTAAYAIACLSDWSPGHRFQIVSEGAIPPLVRLLASPNENIQEEAARALAYLSTPEDQPAHATFESGTPVLRGLLKGASKPIQEEAVQALEQLSVMGWEERCVIATTSDTPALKWLLASPNLYLQAKAAHMISYLRHRDADCQSAIMSADAIAPLVRLLASLSQDVQARAARAVAKLSSSGPELCSGAVSAGACCSLVRLLESTDTDVQHQAACAIANLAAGSAERSAAIVSAGAIPPLVRLLDSIDKDVQRETIRTIANLAAGSPERSAAIGSAGAMPFLVQLLESTDKDVQKQAAMAVGNLAVKSPETRGPAALQSGAT